MNGKTTKDGFITQTFVRAESTVERDWQVCDLIRMVGLMMIVGDVREKMVDQEEDSI